MSNPSASTHAADDVYEGFEQDLSSLPKKSPNDLLQSIAVVAQKRALSEELSSYFTECLEEHPISSGAASESVAIPSADEAVLSVYLKLQQDFRSHSKEILKNVLRFIAVEIKERDLCGEFSNYFTNCLNELEEEFPISSAAASVAITRPFVGAVAAPFAHPHAARGAAAAIACRWGAGCHYKTTTCTFAHPHAAGGAAAGDAAAGGAAAAIACRNGVACPNKGWCRYSHLGAQ